ncbi:SGCB [Cordylochernes scorpioides]|uniref:Beta-sarcoglycan n=1 Tax=Cordylochernes scorpioides TaxID=51811 RepID=A0ABY6K681_9ARAC|nr:SGCB [Cordylochernes scorpioides]
MTTTTTIRLSSNELKVEFQPPPLTGLRGRQGLLFYCLVVVLCLVALCNLAVTLVLLSVLRIGYGMESLELVPPGLLLRFLNHVDLGTVVPSTGEVGGLPDRDLPIIGLDNQPIRNKSPTQPASQVTKQGSGTFRNSDISNFEDEQGSTVELQGEVWQVVLESGGSKLEVGPDGTRVSGVREFSVRSPSTGQVVFSTRYQDFGLPRHVTHLAVAHEANLPRIASPRNSSLLISSPYQVLLRGNEGLAMEGRKVAWTAGQDLYLKSLKGSIVLDGREGVKLAMDKIPVAHRHEGAPRYYKLCVCMPSGRVFRVPVRDRGYGCHDVRFPESINPCT